MWVIHYEYTYDQFLGSTVPLFVVSLIYVHTPLTTAYVVYYQIMFNWKENYIYIYIFPMAFSFFFYSTYSARTTYQSIFLYILLFDRSHIGKCYEMIKSVTTATDEEINDRITSLINQLKSLCDRQLEATQELHVLETERKWRQHANALRPSRDETSYCQPDGVSDWLSDDEIYERVAPNDESRKTLFRPYSDGMPLRIGDRVLLKQTDNGQSVEGVINSFSRDGKPCVCVKPSQPNLDIKSVDLVRVTRGKGLSWLEYTAKQDQNRAKRSRKHKLVTYT